MQGAVLHGELSVSSGEASHDVVEPAGVDGGGAGLVNARPDEGAEADLEVSGDELDLAVFLGLDKHVGEDGQGGFPLDDPL